MLPVALSPAAQVEFFEAYEWYAARSPNLAARFATEIDVLLERIATAPQQFPEIENDVRRARLKRFPYALFFRALGDEIYVIACFHGSRDPRRWQGRN